MLSTRTKPTHLVRPVIFTCRCYGPLICVDSYNGSFRCRITKSRRVVQDAPEPTRHYTPASNIKMLRTVFIRYVSNTTP